jgi:ligand-binding sensor domain-containing protein/signal transduction histidine kinase
MTNDEMPLPVNARLALRLSGFGLLSDFGFRHSGFNSVNATGVSLEHTSPPALINPLYTAPASREKSAMPKLRLALAVAWLSLCGPAFTLPGASNSVPQSAAPFIVNSWGIEKGLPESTVISLTQTRDGYLWLGTLGGLVRFDGVRFTVFNEDNTPGLESSRIVHLFEDSRSDFWVGTETTGVALCRDGVVTSLGIGKGDREGRLMSACEDGSGAVWLYTANGRLCRYADGQVNVWPLGAEFFSNCRVVAAEKPGPLWVGTDAGLFQIGVNGTFKTNQLPVENILPMKVDFLLAGKNGGCWRLADGHVQFWRTNQPERDLGEYPWRADARPAAACEDAEGNLIVGTLGDGVFWYDVDGHALHITSAEGLSYDWVLSLCVDREGSLWVGTDGGGLNRVKRSVFTTATETHNSVVQSVCEDGDGGLWMGINGGGAIYRKGDVTRSFGFTNGLQNLNVWAVFVDNQQRVWAGTWGGLHLFEPQSGQFLPVRRGPDAIQQRVLAIHQDRGGRLWFGTQNGLVCWDGREWKVYTTRDGLTSDAVRAIADDAEGNIWIGTVGGGLNRLSKDGFASFRKSLEGLPSDDISSLYVDGDGVLWIGTFGSGLARFRNGRWARYTTRHGLYSNGIGYVIEDGEGFVWIGSIAGLMRVPKKALNDVAIEATNVISCRVYGEADGLPTSQCTQGSQPGAWRTRDGRLWFPTIKGLVSVDATELKPNPNPPPVVIESVLIQGRAQTTNALRASLPREIVVPPGSEQLEIHYTSLNLAAADRARFRYRMEGYETGWVEAGDIRVALYSKLPPGNYVFQIKARNEDGVWTRVGNTLAVIVLPQFWQTGQFRIATVVFLLGMIIGVVYYLSTQKLQRQVALMRQQEALERDRARIARDLHDQLGASLTQVALLGEMVESDKDLPAEVEVYGQQISKTSREITHVLDEIVWAVNPSNDTLDGLITYVCKYAQEYLAVAGLRYRLDVPTQLPGTPIAPEVRHNVFLAVKEAVTNIVRHAQASEAWLRLRLEPASFTLEIQDNGRGAVNLEKAETRNGLRNMRKRMEDIGGSFSIGPAAEGGTIVRLTAPVRND